MDLIAIDYHFYPEQTQLKSVYNSMLNCYFADTVFTSTDIRIFGTEKQIQDTKNKYIKETGYSLDEAFSFEEEPLNSYYYDKDRNNSIREKLNEYKKLYKENNNKPLIIRI